MRAIVAAGLVLLAVGCGPTTARETRADTGVRAYAATLRSDDPRPAYQLLSKDAREVVSYEEFARDWKASKAERLAQAAEIEEGLKGEPHATERAEVTYADGKTVRLRYQDGTWRLDTSLVSRTVARSPLDAIEIFAQAIDARDFKGVMSILTSRRREGINEFVTRFAASLRKQKGEAGIQMMGKSRAEIKWDEDGVQYKVVLIKEDDEWRVDDFDIVPAPQESP